MNINDYVLVNAREIAFGEPPEIVDGEIIDIDLVGSDNAKFYSIIYFSQGLHKTCGKFADEIIIVKMSKDIIDDMVNI